MQQHRQARAARYSNRVSAFTLISIFGQVMKFAQFLFTASGGQLGVKFDFLMFHLKTARVSSGADAGIALTITGLRNTLSPHWPVPRAQAPYSRLPTRQNAVSPHHP